jgi:type IV secretion system protein VirD4
MQLPAADELVLLSGLPPIKAKKLRYYEDRNFMDRVSPAPVLASGDFADRPEQRPDDWSGTVRGVDPRLSALSATSDLQTDGGLHREPDMFDEQSQPKPAPAKGENFFDDRTVAGVDASLNRLRRMGTVLRAHAINEGQPGTSPEAEPVPEF